ncbi:MAG: F0F1 ATP synthase subunit epsilon, partial [Lachnospiraceae bacterium]|nr:F0F1 ATP synthase subunit epsilon [Lachnospiraceae bacterium]
EIDLNRAEEAKIRAERRLAERELGCDLNRATLALKRSAARIEAVK